MQIFYIIDHVAIIMQCFIKVTPQNNERINIKIGYISGDFFKFHLVAL